MEHKRLKIYGIVQGVYFRRDVRNMAVEIGLCGTIKNMPDKTVEIEVIGENKTINQLITWIKSSPGSAEIDKIETLLPEKGKKFDEFSILY